MLINFNYQDISFFFSYTLFHRRVWIYVCKFHLLISFIISKIHAEMAKRVLFAPNTYTKYLAFLPSRVGLRTTKQFILTTEYVKSYPIC